MLNRLYAFLFLFVLCVFANATLHAQISNIKGADKSIVDKQTVVSDTTKGFAEKGMDYAVTIYYLNPAGEKKELDSTIESIHNPGLLNPWQRDLGNLGTAYQSLKAEVRLPAEYTLLPTQWDAYRFSSKGLQYFNTTKPYSEVRYSSGSKQEQILELFHTQNISPRWNFSTNYRKINSLGFFSAQRSNIDNFKFVSNTVSKNKRYTSHAAFIYNKIQQDENLGIVSDTFLANPFYSNRSIIPVGANVLSNSTRSTILNYRRDASGLYEHSYSIGKTTVSYDEDSLKETTFSPILTFGNKVYYNAERYCFSNSVLDSSFQNNYLDVAYDLADTLFIRYDNNTVGTSFSAEGTVYLKEKVFSLEGGIGIEYQKIGGWASERDALNNYVFGSLNNRKSTDSSWVLDANVKLYYTGLPKGNLSFDALLSKSLPKNIGSIGLEASQYIQQPFYVSESIQVNQINKTTDLQSQINTSLGGFYKNDKLKLKVSVRSLLFNQLIYSSGLEPNYSNYSLAISVQQAQLDKDFSFGKWRMHNEVLLQILTQNTPVQLPFLASFHRLAYHDFIFKRKMQMSTGLDIYYNTAFTNDTYQPVFQSFNPQQTTTYTMIPRVHPFFNFRVKRFRAGLSFDQLQHFITNNNLNYQSYAAQNPLFRFNLRWIFIN